MFSFLVPVTESGPSQCHSVTSVTWRVKGVEHTRVQAGQPWWWNITYVGGTGLLLFMAKEGKINTDDKVEIIK